MPDKLTDSVIVKALECCNSQPQALCCNCPIDIRKIKGGCITALTTYALDLINRLQAENERLKGEVAKEFTCFVGDPHKVEHCPYLEELETAKVEIERLREIRDLCHETILKQGVQIDKLKISDASKEECTIKQHNEIKELMVKLKTAKAEAYKEFFAKVERKINFSYEHIKELIMLHKDNRDYTSLLSVKTVGLLEANKHMSDVLEELVNDN